MKIDPENFTTIHARMDFILHEDFADNIPLPPMDGATVLAGFLRPWRRLKEMMRASPMLALVGLLVAWRIFPYVFGPVFYGIVLGALFG